MRVIVRVIFTALLCLSMPVIADAPVVDDSENFALLEEQTQAAEELPVAQEESYAPNSDNPDAALARDSVSHPANGSTTQNLTLVNTIQALQKEIQELRGLLEVQAHDLDELKQQQLNFYQDLDARLNHTGEPINHSAKHDQTIPAQEPIKEDTSAATLSTNEKSIPTEIQTVPALVQPTTNHARINPADEQISYLAAYDLIKQKQFPQATGALQQFLTHYPHGGYSANAHYWLGELYLTKKDYANAITQFDTVIQNFKSSSKYAHSRLKLGYALAESGRVGEAKEQLLAVMNLYPDTSAAQLAHAKLETLGG